MAMSDAPLVLFGLFALACCLSLQGCCTTVSDAGNSDEVGTCMIGGCDPFHGDTTCVRAGTKARCTCTNGYLNNGKKVCVAPTTCVNSDAAAPTLSLVAAANATFGHIAAKQLQYELNLGATPQVATKSKVTLAILYLFGLNVCGADRCFMGQCCIGTVKGLTIGGLGVWALIDFIFITINMLQKKRQH